MRDQILVDSYSDVDYVGRRVTCVHLRVLEYSEAVLRSEGLP